MWLDFLSLFFWTSSGSSGHTELAEFYLESAINSLAVDLVSRGSTPDLAELRKAADDEDLSFVTRAATEWTDGQNRFDRPGEGLFVAQLGAELVGMCGLNLDPFVNDPETGRLRHLYVAPAWRRQGIARRLVDTCLNLAAGSFDRVRLRTFDPDAAAFYLANGFTPVNEPNATHSIAVGPGSSHRPSNRTAGT